MEGGLITHSHVTVTLRSAGSPLQTLNSPNTTKQTNDQADDEALLDDVSEALALCSGPMACRGRVLTCDYGGGVRVRVREGPLGDGLGARVWAIAHAFCRELAAHPSIVAGRAVLEIGAGTGIVGIAAAKCGAARAVLTDNEAPVLRNLRACAHLNSVADGREGGSGAGAGSGNGISTSSSGSGSGSSGAGGGAPTKANGAAAAAAADGAAAAAAANGAAATAPSNGSATANAASAFHGVTDAELFDDAESVDDFDLADLADVAAAAADEGAAGFSNGGGGGAITSARDDTPEVRAALARREWDAGRLEVRFLDWAESLAALDGAGGGGSGDGGDAGSGEDGSGNGGSDSGTGEEDMPPRVAPGERFSVILGNETMYEPAHARLVAAVLAHRLAPGGRALLCSAVRFKEVFAAFEAACAARGLRHRSARVAPRPEDCDGGILRDDYDGGFVMLAVDRADAPAADWHRGDFA